MKKLVSLGMILVLLLAFAGCGGEDAKGGSGAVDTAGDGGASQENSTAEASEDNFEWDGNTIIALTDAGAKESSLVIPERCEGFNGMIFADKENSVTSVSFESDKDVSLNGVFGSAPNLTSVTLPAELTAIGDLEFQLCTSLKEITIPAGVESVGAYAFQDCSALETVTFAGDTASIMPHAFERCAALSTVTLPDTVALIDEYAFYQCTALTEITLPASLKNVGAFAFANSGLETLHVPGAMTLEGYADTSFTQADHEVAVYVEEGSWADQNFDSVFSGAFAKNYSN